MSKKDQQMAFSDFNLQKLTTSELSENIRASIKVGSNIAIFGRRGTGKTEISKQEIANADMQEVYINLSVLERVDMGGYPNLISPAEKRRNFVEFLLPKFYQPMIEGNKPVVALLDEVDKADPSLWAPLLEFVQFRSINGKPLPNLAAIIMTGNLLSEGGNRPSLPLLDRAEKFLVEADATSWLNWAGRSGKIHPSITAYIHDKPTDLFGAVDPEDRYADPSPRGWARASELLFKGEEQNWSTNLLHKKVCGCVGKDAGLKYSLYYDHYQVLLPMIDRLYLGENIINEFKKLEPTKQIIACMIACARLATKLDQAKESKSKEPVELKYVGKFLSSINSPEKVFISIRSQIQLERIIDWNLDDHPFWKDLIVKIQSEST
jgi:hypothetical protein